MIKSKNNDKISQIHDSHDFLISIHYQENYSWQGTIQWLDTGQKIHFRSELEMLKLIQSAMDKKDKNKFREWSEGSNLKTIL
jgi:alpha-D-ribose 1-methylphosphonate 5-triphosphate synthase subunit PhnI